MYISRAPDKRGGGGGEGGGRVRIIQSNFFFISQK